MQSTILVILPKWAVFFAISLPPSADSAKINIISTNGKQDAARRLEATRGKHGFLCYIFRLWVTIKSLLKQISLYLLSNFRTRIIVLTCPDNKSARNHQPNHACLQNHTNHNDARPILFQLKSSLNFSLFLFVWRHESTTTKSLLRHLNSGIVEDLHCLKAVDRNFVRNGGTTRTHSSLFSWAGESEQIANSVLFWLRLSKI